MTLARSTIAVQRSASSGDRPGGGGRERATAARAAGIVLFGGVSDGRRGGFADSVRGGAALTCWFGGVEGIPWGGLFEGARGGIDAPAPRTSTCLVTRSRYARRRPVSGSTALDPANSPAVMVRERSPSASDRSPAPRPKRARSAARASLIGE